jgi:hypothetical protein
VGISDLYLRAHATRGAGIRFVSVELEPCKNFLIRDALIE